MTGFVYIIKNTVNSKVYVGKTTRTIEIRFEEHCSDHSGCIAINGAIKKYGKEYFEIIPLFQSDSIEEINKKEQEFIRELNSISPNGYNLRIGGVAPEMSDETRKKMSVSAKKRFESQEERDKISKTSKGRVVSGETRKKISEGHLGKTKTEETRKRMSNAWKGVPKPKSEEWCINQSIKMTGKVRSEEAKKKMAEAKKKRIICNETQTIYPSIAEAANILGCHPDSLKKHLSGKYRQCKGLTFKVLEKDKYEK